MYELAMTLSLLYLCIKANEISNVLKNFEADVRNANWDTKGQN